MNLSSVFAQKGQPPPAVTDTAAKARNEKSETSGEQNYYIEKSGEEFRFIQRLFWEESKNASRYELIVERREQNGKYKEAQRISVEQAFAEVSLDAGHYRYKVQVYDLLDALSFTTNWREFNVIQALQPELTSISPQAFFLDEEEAWVITLHGKNLLPESEFCLIKNKTKITPQSHVSEGTSANLVFSKEALVPGTYVVYAKNPGGLDAHLESFTIGYKNKFDLNISLGYAPVVPLYGYLFKDFSMEAPFTGIIYPLGAITRISCVPFKQSWGCLGVEFSGSFTFLEHDREFYTAKAFFFNTHLGFLYQRFFLEKTLAINVSLGAGITTLLDFHYEYPIGSPANDKTTLYPSAIAGVSAMLFFVQPFYVNMGMDFIHVFSPGGDRPMPGFFRPFVTAGIQL